jgi:hypothetical protein
VLTGGLRQPRCRPRLIPGKPHCEQQVGLWSLTNLIGFSSALSGMEVSGGTPQVAETPAQIHVRNLSGRWRSWIVMRFLMPNVLLVLDSHLTATMTLSLNISWKKLPSGVIAFGQDTSPTIGMAKFSFRNLQNGGVPSLGHYFYSCGM